MELNQFIFLCTMILGAICANGAIPTDLTDAPTVTLIASNGAGNVANTNAADPNAAQLNWPFNTVHDGTDMYVADYNNKYVRKLDKNYNFHNVAGTGVGATVLADVNYQNTAGTSVKLGTLSILALGGPTTGKEFVYGAVGSSLHYIFRIELTSGSYNYDYIAGDTTQGCVSHTTGTSGQVNYVNSMSYRKTDNSLLMTDSGCQTLSKVAIGTANYPLTTDWIGATSTAGEANGPAATARVRNPTGVCLDFAEATLYFTTIADTGGYKYGIIKKIINLDSTRDVSTVAGTDSGATVTTPTLTIGAAKLPEILSLAWYNNYKTLVMTTGVVSGGCFCGALSYDIATGAMYRLAGTDGNTCGFSTTTAPAATWPICLVTAHFDQNGTMPLSCPFYSGIALMNMPFATDTVTASESQTVTTSQSKSLDIPTPAPPTPAPPTPAPPTPAPPTPAPPTPVPVTSTPATPAPITPVPATPTPETPVPATPVPDTPVPATPVPATPVPITPAPDTPAPATPIPPVPLPPPPTPTPVVSSSAASSSEVAFSTPVPDTPAPATSTPSTPAPSVASSEEPVLANQQAAEQEAEFWETPIFIGSVAGGVAMIVTVVIIIVVVSKKSGAAAAATATTAVEISVNNVVEASTKYEPTKPDMPPSPEETSIFVM